MSSNAQKFTAFKFNAAGVAPRQPMEALPGGWYPVIIVDGEIKPGSREGTRMELEWSIIDGPYKNRKTWDGFNVEHSNAQTQEIAQQDLSAICHATGVIDMVDVQQFYNIPHEIKLGIEPGRWVDAANKAVGSDPLVQPTGAVKWYDAKNSFKGARPLGKGVATPGAPAASGAASAAGAAPVTPPWAAKPGAAAAPAAPAPAKAPAAPAAAPAAPKAAKAPAAPKAAPVPSRKFFVFLGGNDMPLKTEAEVLEMLGQGMPADTQLSLAGDDDGFVDGNGWKSAADHKVAPAPAPAPAAATPAGAPIAPPWARK